MRGSRALLLVESLSTQLRPYFPEGVTVEATVSHRVLRLQRICDGDVRIGSGRVDLVPIALDQLR